MMDGVKKVISHWKTLWTHERCKVRSRRTATILAGVHLWNEEIVLSCPDAPLEVASEDYSSSRCIARHHSN